MSSSVKIGTQAVPQQMSPVTKTPPMHMHSSSLRRRNLLLDLPIASRLTLGFLLAGLIAALVSGIIGVQRSQSLSSQSDFYQSLLSTNTSLTTGANFLELMNTEMHALLTEVSSPTPSQETTTTDEQAITNLTSRYNSILTSYVAHDLVSQHADQSALLAEANRTIQISQQQTLAGSALRTWVVYEQSQQQIVQDIKANNLQDAQNLERAQAEPTNADAQSAIRSLIQFDGRLATSVQDAAQVEEQSEIITTIIGAIIAFICIALVGLLISNTLVQRLKHLRQVTLTVERGQINSRVSVVGRDEIANVSASVNAMLETIVGLLDETRSQRDALTNAAEHLFSEMHVVSAGELRVNAPTSSDPIGMLADAFNFTIGRFRRFLLRTQNTAEQVEGIARREMERSELFIKTVQAQMQSSQSLPATPVVPTTGPFTKSRPLSGDLKERGGQVETDVTPLVNQLRQAREHLQMLHPSSNATRIQSVQFLFEQLMASIARLNKIASSGGSTQMALQELRVMENLTQRLSGEARQTQQQAGNVIGEVDSNLEQFVLALRQFNFNSSMNKGEQTAIREQEQELARQSVRFAREVSSLARQLTKITQEMRSGVVAFQLETPTSGSGRV